MDTQPAVNPFVPGRGQLPPFLAGRQEEQRALGELLAYLQAGRGAPRDAILSGPRGNGKTVLLRWFQQEVEASARKIDTVWLTPSELGSLDALATLLVPPRQFRALRPGYPVVLDRDRAARLGIGRSVRVADPIAGGTLRAATAGAAARRSAHAGRGGGPSAPQRQPVGQCGSPVPAGDGGHAGIAGTPQPHVGHFLEPRREARHRVARRSGFRASVNAPLVGFEPADHFCRCGAGPGSSVQASAIRTSCNCWGLHSGRRPGTPSRRASMKAWSFVPGDVSACSDQPATRTVAKSCSARNSLTSRFGLPAPSTAGRR